jgi:hypothetical protein
LIPGSPWTLQTCGVPDGPRLPIDASLAGQVATEPTWQWVTGILDRRSGASHLVPRDTDDVRVTHHDDVCL